MTDPTTDPTIDQTPPGPPRRGARSIRARLLAIAWIPSFTLLVVGITFAGILAQRGESSRSFGSDLQAATPSLSRLLTAIATERQLSVALAADPGPVGAQLAAARREVDATVPSLTSGKIDVAGLDRASSSTAGTNLLDGDLSGLKQLRAQVDGGTATPVQAYTAYGRLLGAISAIFRGVGQGAPTPELTAAQFATADTIDLLTARSDVSGLTAIATHAPGLTEDQYRQFVTATGTYRVGLNRLLTQGTPQQRRILNDLTGSDAWRNEIEVQGAVLHTALGPNGTYPATLPTSRTAAATADATVSQVVDGLVRDQLAATARLSERYGRSQLVRSLIAAGALLAIALAVLLISTRLSRTLIGRLRDLRNRTLELADVRLPAMVERLRRGEPVDVEAEVAPIDAGDDEIGQVATAFGKAQRTAVDAAATEAETRAGTGKVFLNIARRSQVIVHRQLRVLDQAERSQDDPDQLKFLFELDHLSTRARRNAENLIILGGGRPGRQWRRPVPMSQVVRSAIGESERYVRVSTGELPPVPVDGSAVADIVHLLAELVDNATNFSPPTSRVEVRGNVVGRGVVIEIEDQGLGLDPHLYAEINQMLADPPDFSVMALSEEPRLGLFVVARLAARHGIRVTLAEAPHYGGTRAIVLVPNALLSPEAPVDGTAESPAPEAPPAPAPPAIPSPAPAAEDPFPTPGRPALPTRSGGRGRRAVGAPVTAPTGLPADTPPNGLAAPEPAPPAQPAPSPTRPPLPSRAHAPAPAGSAPNGSAAPSDSASPAGSAPPTGSSSRTGSAASTGPATPTGPGSRTGSAASTGSATPTGLGSRTGSATPTGPAAPISPAAPDAGSPSPESAPANGSAAPTGAHARGGAPGEAPTSTRGDARTGAPAQSGAGDRDGAASPARAGTAGAAAARPVSGGRPELPQRVRQTNLVPQLMTDPAPEPQPRLARHVPEDAPAANADPEQARNRFASLQRGTRAGRTGALRTDQDGRRGDQRDD